MVWSMTEAFWIGLAMLSRAEEPIQNAFGMVWWVGKARKIGRRVDWWAEEAFAMAGGLN